MADTIPEATYICSYIHHFLSLNILSLEKQRWVQGETRQLHCYWNGFTWLLVVNAVAANLWLGQISSLRVDVTRGNQYSISDATEGYLNQLQEHV